MKKKFDIDYDKYKTDEQRKIEKILIKNRKKMKIITITLAFIYLVLWILLYK